MNAALRAVDTFQREGMWELAARTCNVAMDRAFPRVPAPLTTVRWYLSLRSVLLSEPYSEGDPFELHYVDPTRIEYISGLSRIVDGPVPLRWGQIESGDWDQGNELFDDRPAVRSIALHYEQGVAWESTPVREYFGEMIQQVNWRYSSPDEFDDYTAGIEKLVEAIGSRGYVPKRDLAKRGSIGTNDPVPPVLDEVTVDVGRDGQLLWRDFGKHRLAVAKLLDIDRIPVLIGAVHEDFTGTGDCPVLS